MMIEESETPKVGSHSEPAADALAERRARHADPAVIKRAEAAEAVARNLETHLAALEQRIEEVGRERQRVTHQLAERESDVRNVKQREYTEQQLRVEAEERSERLQREMLAEIQQLRNRLEQTEQHVHELSAELAQLRDRDARLTPIVRELMEVASGLRAGFERELTALREELQQQVIWERETYVRELTAMGARMEDLRFELTRTAADLRAQLNEPLDPALFQHTTEPQSEREAAHRRELADALVAAVERLRARVADVKQAETEEQALPATAESPDMAGSPDMVEASDIPESPVMAEPAAVVQAPAEEQPSTEPVAESYIVEEPSAVEEHPAAEELSAVEEPSAVEEAPAAESPVVGESHSAEDPPAIEQPRLADQMATDEPAPFKGPAPLPPIGDEPVAAKEDQHQLVEQPLVEDQQPVVEDQPVEEPVGEESVVEEDQLVEDDQPVEEQPLPAEGLAAPIAATDRLAPPVPLSGLGLGPRASAPPRAVAYEPVALQSRLLSVPEKRISWLAPAIRRLAAERDAKLAAELVIELIPAQRELVDGSVSYEIKIGELGTFYVTLDPGHATISREPRGEVDFSLEGPVAAFSELAAGGAKRRYPGLRLRKGRRRARRFLKTRRQPIALADLAAADVDVWPGLLLLAIAEAIDPSWTTGKRFELAFEIEDTAGIVIYVRINDGASILVSRTAVGQPVATVSLSGQALICLLAGTEPPADHKTLVRGDITSVDMFLQWTARAQGLSVSSS